MRQRTDLFSGADQSFRPFLEKIDQIETGVQTLEETVMQLDEYSKRLGNSFSPFLADSSPRSSCRDEVQAAEHYLRSVGCE